MGKGKCLICPIQHVERLPVYMVQCLTVQQHTGMKPYLVQIKYEESIYAEVNLITM